MPGAGGRREAARERRAGEGNDHGADASLPTLRRGFPLLIVAALLAATRAACGGGEEQERATETATSAPAADETAPGEMENAARRLLADEPGVAQADVRLESSEGMTWSDASPGCPREGAAYAQVITPGYRLVFELLGTPYAVHTTSDGSEMVICGDGR